jgi:eukaryotic-like serine/threonine-protein kinase
MAKDPEDRWQTARDVLLELRWIAEGSSQAGLSAPTVPVPRKKKALLPWLTTGLLLIAATFFGYHYFHSTTVAEPQIRFAIYPPDKAAFYGSIALSPDGRKLAFVAREANGATSLWVRSLDSISSFRLSGTDSALYPFWSPDSRSIAFFAEGELKKIDPSAGHPETICKVPDSRGGAWGRDGTIVFTPTTSDVMYRVAASGGVATPITNFNSEKPETSQRWPQFLPDGKHFLFLSLFDFSANGGTNVSIGSLNSKITSGLFAADSAAIYAEGRVIFIRNDSLMCQKFDPEKLKLEGDPVSISSGVWSSQNIYGLSGFSASETGVLAFRGGGSERSQLTWYDRTGKKLGAASPPASEAEPHFSPDEKHLIANKGSDLWIMDLSSGKWSRFTFDPSDDGTAAYSPDGSLVFFGSNRKGKHDI